MADTITLLGQYLYQAEARPRGTRNLRRVLLAATTEYGILSLAERELEGEIRFSPRKDRVVSLKVGPDGRLWRPAGVDAPVTLDAYRGDLAEWATNRPAANPLFPGNERVPLRRDPIATARGPDDHFGFPDLAGLDVHAEDGFRGDILFADKARAAERHAASARHVAAIGGEIHYSAMAPVWLARPEPGGRTVEVALTDRLPGFVPGNFHQNERGTWGLHNFTIGYESFSMFDATRKDEAEAFAALGNPGAKVGTAGRILGGADLLRPDPRPLQAVLHGALEGLAGGIDSCKDHLDFDAYALWGRMVGWGRNFRPYGTSEVPAPPFAVDDLTQIRDHLGGRLLPPAVAPHASTLTELIDDLSRRQEFERSLLLAREADEGALSALGNSR